MNKFQRNYNFYGIYDSIICMLFLDKHVCKKCMLIKFQIIINISNKYTFFIHGIKKLIILLKKLSLKLIFYINKFFLFFCTKKIEALRFAYLFHCQFLSEL